MMRKRLYFCVLLIASLAAPLILTGCAPEQLESLPLNRGVFYDDFTGDLTKWTVFAGDFALVSGNLQTTNLTSGEAILLVGGGKSLVDGTIASTINYTNPGTVIGFVARYQAGGNYYFAGFQGNYMFIYRFRDDGARYGLDLKYVDLPVGTYFATFTVTGRKLTFTIADNSLTVVDDSLSRSGQWGVRSTGLGNEWQDFALADLQETSVPHPSQD